jgi:putative ABC transport system permease protein
MTFLNDLAYAARSLRRVKGLALTVVLTLALGIGANAAIVSVVRGVLLRPLVNRGEDRLLYIRQSAPGIGVENEAFSIPEIQDLRERVKTLAAFGDFSTISFTMVGLGEPRQVRAGVVSGSYFDVMGQDDPPGLTLGDGHRGAGTVGALPVGDRAHRQCRHQPAPHVGDDGHGA